VILKKPFYCLFAAQLVLFVAFFPTTASAATTGDTNLTLVVNAFTPSLAISVPSTGTFTPLTSPDTSTDATLELGTITVTDNRRLIGGGWTTEASASSLTSSGDSLTADTFGYSSGVFVKTGGAATMTENTRTSLDISGAVVTTTSVTGNHVVTWTPIITVPVPASQAPGTYTGTITHSVS